MTGTPIAGVPAPVLWVAVLVLKALPGDRSGDVRKAALRALSQLATNTARALGHGGNSCPQPEPRPFPD